MGIWKKNIDIYNELAEVEEYIRQGLDSKQKTLDKAINQLLDAGGKRLRPALVLLSGMFGRYDKDKLIPLAAAIEILHMATLVHDDIIDDAKLRRGVPTVQSRWGKDVAVFTGDYLFTRAFSMITRNTSFENMHNISRAIKLICEGEIEQFEIRYNKNTNLKNYLRRIGRKTALLFILSCQVGASESKCTPDVSWNLRHLGGNLGMAFQITDDLLDFHGDVNKTGKPIGRDFIQGIYTLPVIYAMNQHGYKTRIAEIMEADMTDSTNMYEIRRLVDESGGIDYTKKLAVRYLDRARTNISNLPSKPAREALDELIYELVERKY